MKSGSKQGGHHPTASFVTDMLPFFAGRAVVYVDVGAYKGFVFEELVKSQIRIRSALLIEPNPASYRELEKTVERLDASKFTVCCNVAASSSRGKLSFCDDGLRTHVKRDPGQATPSDVEWSPSFEADCVPLDELLRAGEINHVSILKVDVEGHELEVFQGARDLLTKQAVDVIYVEAGADPDSKFHTYYRDIEDQLREYGYRVFKAYEQVHEWKTDSPVMRRSNIAFLSEEFAKSHPLKLSRRLFEERHQKAAVRRQLASAHDHAHQLELRVAGQERQRAAMLEYIAALETSNAKLFAQRHLEPHGLDWLLKDYPKRPREVDAALSDNPATASRPLGAGSAKSTRTGANGSLPSVANVGRLLRVPPRATRFLEKVDRRLLRLKHKVFRTVGARTSPSEQSRKRVRDLLKASDYNGCYAMLRELEATLCTDEGLMLHATLATSLYKKLAAFEFGVSVAEGAFEFFGGQGGRLRKFLGKRAYRQFVADMAFCLTRVGRYDDARRLLDTEIEAGHRELLPARAEVCWVRDPVQAEADLADWIRTDSDREGDRLLRSHLQINVLRSHDGSEDDRDVSGQMHLVRAVRALSDGRFEHYRTSLNSFFEEQGLSAPLAKGIETFSFDALASPGLPRIEEGPLVSVVMTTYNAAETVRYAVRSILEQTYQNIELLIVDDCSSDETREILAELEAQDSRVRVIHNELNLGTYGSKNLALEVARGAYWTCHDSDDWAHPQRIATHVNVMQADRSLVGSRSNWLRVSPKGALEFRRWHKRLTHPNPASAFFKRKVIQRLGFFDAVRFGADTEYWFRAMGAYGRGSLKNVSQCLALGLLNDASLTQAGAGALDSDSYSPMRSAYRYSWFEAQGSVFPNVIFLDASPTERAFWAPPSMLGNNLPPNEGLVSRAQLYPGASPGAPIPNFFFGISFVSKQASSDWNRAVELLSRTLRSVLGQSEPRFRVLIAGHDRPDIPELDDPRITFMVADIDPPAGPEHFRRDKMYKRRRIGVMLRQLGGGYFFPLDADDLVHKDLVAHVFEDDNRRGYNIRDGYAEDFSNQRLAPVPGVWGVTFDRVCGSSAVLYFEPNELPTTSQNDPSLPFNLFQSHAYWPVVAEELGRPLATVPFPAAVYVVNHAQNLSFGLQRAGSRAERIVSAIERHAVPHGSQILIREFSQSEG